jgi:hypothetical protein
LDFPINDRNLFKMKMFRTFFIQIQKKQHFHLNGENIQLGCSASKETHFLIASEWARMRYPRGVLDSICHSGLDTSVKYRKFDWIFVAVLPSLNPVVFHLCCYSSIYCLEF